MATRSYTEYVGVNQYKRGIIIVKWTGLLNGDTGIPYPGAFFPDKSVHIYGTLGAGGTIIIQGSNDQDLTTTNYITLNDPANNALSFTAAGLKAVMENTFLIRPNVTAGDGTTNLTCIVVMETSR